MFARRLSASLFHLSQLRGKVTAFRVGLGVIAVEVRLTLGELADRRSQRHVVPLLLVAQGGSVGIGELFFERSARGAFLPDLLFQLRLAFGRFFRARIEMCGLRL